MRAKASGFPEAFASFAVQWEAGTQAQTDAAANSVRFIFKFPPTRPN